MVAEVKRCAELRAFALPAAIVLTSQCRHYCFDTVLFIETDEREGESGRLRGLFLGAVFLRPLFEDAAALLQFFLLCALISTAQRRRSPVNFVRRRISTLPRDLFNHTVEAVSSSAALTTPRSHSHSVTRDRSGELSRVSPEHRGHRRHAARD